MIIRSDRKVHFTVIPNAVINDVGLDWRDLGLLAYLLSKPDNWQVNPMVLAKERKTGIKGLYASLKVLQEAGYATRRPDPKGGWLWTIYDLKHDSAPNAEKRHTEKTQPSENPANPRPMPNADKRNAEKRHTEIHPANPQHMPNAEKRHTEKPNAEKRHTETKKTTPLNSVAQPSRPEKLPNAEKRQAAENAEWSKSGMPKMAVLISTEYKTNTEKKVNTEGGARLFKKPTFQEVENYCKNERKNSIDPNRFFNHYESNGWKVGSNRMKDWKAAVRKWETTPVEKPRQGNYKLTTEDIYADF